MKLETRRVRVPLLAPSKLNKINALSKQSCLLFGCISGQSRSKRQLCDSFARSLIAAALCGAMAACGGGGGDNSAPPQGPYQAVYPVPLRNCEATGPTAPPCSASQAAGAH